MRYTAVLDWIKEKTRRVKEQECSSNEETGRRVTISPGNSELFIFDGESFDYLKQPGQDLRSNQIVEELVLKNVCISTKGSRWLRDLLVNKTDLLALHLCDTTIVNMTETMTMAEEKTDWSAENCKPTLQAIDLARGLEENETLQRLHLKSNQLGNLGPIGLMLSKNRFLTELRICHNSIDAEAAISFCQGLQDNKTLEVIDLTGNGMKDEAVELLCQGLVLNSSVRSLCLDFNNFTKRGVAAISHMLSQNSILQDLNLFGNHIDEEGGRLLACALTTTKCRLSTLHLSFNDLGDFGATYIAKALTVNTSLKKLWIAANQFGNQGFMAFAEHLPNFHGLQQLNIGDCFGNEAAFIMLQSMRSNFELQVLYMESILYDDERTEYLINFYIQLNRAGRKLLCHQPNFPAGLWANVLARTSTNAKPEIIYYLLREKPELVEMKK